MSASPTPTHTAVDAARLRLAVMRLARRVRQQAGGGITPSQLSALATVDRQGPLRSGELATAEGISPSSLTRIIAALEQQALLERTTDPTDRRVALVAITLRGRRLLQAARDRGTQYVAGALDRLDPDQLAMLAAAVPVLEALVESEQ